MKGVVVIDSNLLVLLVVGAASRDYVAKHKNTRSHFSLYDLELLGLIVSEFSEIILLPHIVAETSNLAGQIGGAARADVMHALGVLISTAIEMPIASLFGVRRDDYIGLGVTDAIILHFCGLSIDGIGPTLVTIDGPLADRAHSLGYSVIDYKRVYQSSTG